MGLIPHFRSIVTAAAWSRLLRIGRTGRIGLLALVAAAVLCAAGCGASGSGTPASTGAAGSPAATSAASQTHYPITITEPDGKKAVIKSPPTRIVTVDLPAQSVEDLLALGVRPIGGEYYSEPGTGYEASGIPDYDQASVPSFADMGNASSPDLEKIIAEHPDLIVGTEGTATTDYKQLEAIAPLLSMSTNSGSAGTGVEGLPWYPELKTLAMILNRQRQFNAFVSSFEKAAAPVQSKLKGLAVSWVIWSGAADVAVIGPKYNGATYEKYMGLTIEPLPAAGRLTSPGNAGVVALLSQERISPTSLPGRILEVEMRPGVPSFVALPLVARLPSVKAGRVVVDNDGIFGGYPVVMGPIGQLKAIPYFGKAFEQAAAGNGSVS